MRVAVTGASGFCGGAVAALASARGADVICLGRRPATVGRHVPWDALGPPPDLAGADLLVHCAAVVGDFASGSRSTARLRAVNVDGAARVLDAAADLPVVWLSSASVYDPATDRLLVREDHPVRRQLNAYGRTKAEGERLALDAGAVVLRPRAVYGPGDSQLLPRLVRKARSGVLPLPGPDVRLSLTSVENLAHACLEAADWPPGAYNIADADPYSRDDAVRRVLRAHGVRARLYHVPVALAAAVGAAGEALSRVGPWAGREPFLSRYAVDQLARTVILDISKARLQGWHPRRTLSDFLEDLRTGG
jgi:nucleoside-diphosphate-sugar epimerase